MRTRHGFALALSLLVLCAAPWLPRVAHASRQCQCHDGSIVESMDDDANCDEVCSDKGGGTVWSLGDDGRTDDDSGEITLKRRPSRSAPEKQAPDTPMR